MTKERTKVSSSERIVYRSSEYMVQRKTKTCVLDKDFLIWNPKSENVEYLPLSIARPHMVKSLEKTAVILRETTDLRSLKNISGYFKIKLRFTLLPQYQEHCFLTEAKFGTIALTDFSQNGSCRLVSMKSRYCKVEKLSEERISEQEAKQLILSGSRQYSENPANGELSLELNIS
jgi:hypothetical protein